MSVHKHPEATLTDVAAMHTGAKATNRDFPLKLVAGLMLAVAFAVAAAALLLPRESRAQQAVDLTPDQAAVVKRVQDYINAISTVEARFVQVTNKGHSARGRLWVQRPGRLRFDYDPPTPILIVSDGETLLLKDEEMDHFSYGMFSETPAALFIGKDVNFFSDELAITNFQNEFGTIYVSMVKQRDPRGGALTLVLDEKPMQLRKWMVVDPQGVATTVSLLSPKFGQSVSPDLFVVEQRWRTEREQRDR